jgi:hypothetical protein
MANNPRLIIIANEVKQSQRDYHSPIRDCFALFKKGLSMTMSNEGEAVLRLASLAAALRIPHAIFHQLMLVAIHIKLKLVKAAVPPPSLTC